MERTYLQLAGAEWKQTQEKRNEVLESDLEERSEGKGGEEKTKTPPEEPRTHL